MLAGTRLSPFSFRVAPFCLQKGGPLVFTNPHYKKTTPILEDSDRGATKNAQECYKKSGPLGPLFRMQAFKS